MASRAFDKWKSALLISSGSVSPSVRSLGDYVLELFWRDGCEPTVTALLDYAQGGLSNRFAHNRESASSLPLER